MRTEWLTSFYRRGKWSSEKVSDVTEVTQLWSWVKSQEALATLHVQLLTEGSSASAVISVSWVKNSWNTFYALIMPRKDHSVFWFGGNAERRERKNCNSHNSLWWPYLSNRSSSLLNCTRTSEAVWLCCPYFCLLFVAEVCAGLALGLTGVGSGLVLYSSGNQESERWEINGSCYPGSLVTLI